jgi:TP901 family phage tail tape measure protein
MSDPQGAMLGNAYGYIDLDASGAIASLNQTRQHFNNFIQSTGAAMQGWGSQIAGFGQSLTMWTAPLTVAGGIGLKVASDFDSVLTEIQARTGLTTEAMAAVRQAALDAGADTAFSSQQAADALLNLLTAGLSTEEALATLPAVLDAAAAGGISLASAADYTTSVMAAFGLTAQDTTAIVNAMARASAASPATMDEMGAALQRVGGMAASFGLDVEETTAILAIFAQTGLRGSDAGTALASLLRNMQRDVPGTTAAWDALGTSLYNADGTMRNLDDVFRDIKVGLAGMTDEQRNRVIQDLAGAEGMVAFNALLASEGIADMQASMDSQASASEVAAQMMSSFAGQVDSLMGSIEALWITVLTPFMNNVLRPLIGMGIAMVNGIQKWAAANEPLVQTIMTMVSGLIALGPTIFAVGNGLEFFGFVLSAIGSPIGLLVSGLGLLAYIFRDQLGTALRIAGDSFAIFLDMFSTTGDFLGAAVSAINTFLLSFGIAMGMPAASAAEMVSGINASFRSLIQIVRQAAGFIVGVVDNIASSIGFFFQFLGEGENPILAFGRALNVVFGSEETDGQVRAFFDVIRSGIAFLDNTIGRFIRSTRSALTLFFDLLGRGIPALEALKTSFTSVFSLFDWAQLGTDIFNGLSAGLSAIGGWVNDNLITPLMGAFSLIDWGIVGNTILQGIGLAISLYSGWINFVTDHILTPLFDTAKNVLGTIDWRQLGEDIIGFIFDPSSSNAAGVNWGEVFGGWMSAIGNFASSVFDFLGWTLDSVIRPLWQGMIDGLAQVDWGQVWTTFLDLAGQALNTLWTGATWAYDNFIKPMIDAAGLALSQVDWQQLGLDILNALGAGLMVLWGAATWAYDNLILPLFDSAKLAIESIDWFEVGENIVNAIGIALQTTFDFVAWIIDSIFNPITSNTDAATGAIDWAGVGEAIMGAISSAIIGFYNFVDWLVDTIFSPLLDGAGQAINNLDWSVIGGNLMDAIKNGLPNMQQWVQDWIIAPILAALAGFNPLAGVPTGTTQMGGSGYQAQVQATVSGAAAGVMGTFGSFASGINFVPNDMIAMIHEGERIQRANENPYNPDAQASGVGRQFNFGDIIIESISASSPQEATMLGNTFGDAFMKRIKNSGIEDGI